MLKLEPGRLYHIYTRPNSTSITPNIFLKNYITTIEPIAETFAYCLLPDHIHFVVRPRTFDEQIAWWMQDGESMDAFDPKDVVAQFQKFHPNLCAIPIQAHLDCLHLIRYVHQNPVLHGVTDQFQVYKWSSYQTLKSERSTRLQRETVLQWFYTPEWFEEIHWVPVELDRIGYLIAED